MSRQHHRRKLLCELLKEEQEPFVLDAFLQEKRAQTVRKQQHHDPTTTLGQLLLRRPTREAVVAVEAAAPCCSPSSSTWSSSLVSIPKSSRWGPCSSSSSMATLTRHHPLVNKTSSLRLVSPFPEPGRRTALCILLEAAAGRAQRKLSKRQRSKTKCKVSKQRNKLGGSGGGLVLRSLFSSLVKRRTTTNRKEMTDGQQVPVSTMGDILNWKWKRGQQENDGLGRCVWDEKYGESSRRTAVRHWDDEQRRASSPTTTNSSGLGKEVMDHDEELGDFVCSWGYANHPPASDGCSTSGSSSGATGTITRHHPWGSSFSCSTLSLSSLCDNRTGDNLDEPGSTSSSWTIQGGSSSPLHHQQQQEEEEVCMHAASPLHHHQQQEEEGEGAEDDGQLVSGDDDAVEGAAAGPAPQNHRSSSACEDGVLEQEQRSGNDPHGPCSCSCGAAEKDQLSPVSVLEPAAPFDDDEEEAADEQEKKKGSSSTTGDGDCSNSTTGRDRDGDGRKDVDEAAEIIAFKYEQDGGIVVDVDESRFQRSLTIVLESRDQILRKLKRLAAAGIEPVNLDESFAASREEQCFEDDVGVDQHRCCASEHSAEENEAEGHCTHDDRHHQQLQLTQLLLRPCSWNHKPDATASHNIDDDWSPYDAPEAAGLKQLVINGKFIVKACWEDAADTVVIRTGTTSTTTIDMMVEADLTREGNALLEWKGAAKDQAAEVVTGIEASIFTLLIHEFYCDLYTTTAQMHTTCY